MTSKASNEPKPRAPPTSGPPPTHDRVHVYETRWYWITLFLSVLVLLVGLWFNADYLPLLAQWIQQATVILAATFAVLSAFALLRRGRVVHRTVRGTKRAVGSLVEGVRDRGERAEGTVEKFFGRLARALKWIVLLPVRIVVWAWYTAEKLFWRLLLLLYDVVYYPTYTAWILTLFAIRVALRLVRFALRVAWSILRLPTRVWPLRRWWRTKKMPQIMGAWNLFVAHRKHVRAMKIDRGRRLAALRGENPDRWQADHELRRGFPLPHPERARIAIRRRITYILEVQRARREGRPLPAHLTEARERKKLERRKAREALGGAQVRIAAEAAEPAERKRGKAKPGAEPQPEPSSV